MRTASPQGLHDVSAPGNSGPGFYRAARFLHLTAPLQFGTLKIVVCRGNAGPPLSRRRIPDPQAPEEQADGNPSAQNSVGPCTLPVQTEAWELLLKRIALPLFFICRTFRLFRHGGADGRGGPRGLYSGSKATGSVPFGDSRPVRVRLRRHSFCDNRSAPLCGAL